MGKPAARVTDSTSHLMLPLAPGTGSTNTIISMMPAWRALPAAMAAGLTAMRKGIDIGIKAAESARSAASGTPAMPAALAAEAAAKGAAVAAMTAAMNACKVPLPPSFGVPDTHMCTMPSPPVMVPHGPGMVSQGSKTVMVNGLPLSRQGDPILEALGPPNKIVLGAFTVLIGG